MHACTGEEVTLTSMGEDDPTCIEALLTAPNPSTSPSKSPSSNPTEVPTGSPSKEPTQSPSRSPSKAPTPNLVPAPACVAGHTCLRSQNWE
eukprot:1114379_1